MKKLLFAALFFLSFSAQASYTPPGGANSYIQYNNNGSFAGRQPQGSGLKVQMSTGTATSNDCVKFDSNGNAVDAGFPCGAGQANPTVFACDGSDQTTLISAALVTGANLLFTGTCKTTNITKTGIALTMDFAQGAKLTPAGSSLLDVLWKFTSSDIYIKKIDIDGNQLAQTGIFFDGGTSAAHKLQVDNAHVINMGSATLSATNIITGFEIRNYAVGSLMKIGKFVAKDYNAIGNGSCGDSLGSVRGIYMSDNAATVDIQYFEDSGGTDIEDNDFFHAQLNTAGGVIHNFVARYNQNTRRAYKQQSGNWTIEHVDVRPGPDFVSCSNAGIATPSYCGASAFGSGTQIGKYNLNAIDYASSGTNGQMQVVSGYVDCTGSGSCVTDSGGGGAVVTGPNLTLVGPTAFETRDATACNGALAASNSLGVYAPPADVGTGVNGTKIINFAVATLLQGTNNFVKNAIIYDPVFEIAELSSSTQKNGDVYTGNTIYSVTSGYLNNTRMGRILNASNITVANNQFIEQGNTSHATTLFGFTDTNATGIASNNKAPSGTTAVSVGSSSILNCDTTNGYIQSVVCGGTGLASGTSGGIPYFSGTTTLASSGLLTQHAITIGGGAGAAPYPLASLGTSTTVLHGAAAGDPTFAAVNLTNDVTGTLASASLPSPLAAPASITTASITPAISTATFSTNASLGNTFHIALVHASCPCTIANPTNPVDGQKIVYDIIQSATGSDTIGTWDTAFSFGAQAQPTLSTAANKHDEVAFIYNSGASKWYYLGSELGF